MKKITLIFTLAVMAIASFAAEYKFPGWLCEDNTLIETQYLNAKEAGKIDSQINCLVLMKFNKGKIKSFAELKTVVAAVVNEVYVNQKDRIADKTIFFVKQMCLCRNQFVAEAWNYCKANPSDYDIHFVLRYGNNKICSEEERYAFLVNYLLAAENANNIGINLVKRCVEKVIDVGVTANVTTQKADLQKINRRFSKNLLVNKAGWEPIIAMVRTAIETY